MLKTKTQAQLRLSLVQQHLKLAQQCWFGFAGLNKASQQLWGLLLFQFNLVCPILHLSQLEPKLKFKSLIPNRLKQLQSILIYIPIRSKQALEASLSTSLLSLSSFHLQKLSKVIQRIFFCFWSESSIVDCCAWVVDYIWGRLEY